MKYANREEQLAALEETRTLFPVGCVVNRRADETRWGSREEPLGPVVGYDSWLVENDIMIKVEVNGFVVYFYPEELKRIDQ